MRNRSNINNSQFLIMTQQTLFWILFIAAFSATSIAQTVDATMQKLIQSDYTAPISAGSSDIYKRLLTQKNDELTKEQRLSLQKCYAQALFTEGKYAEARRGFDTIRPKEIELQNERLAAQGVDGNLTELAANLLLLLKEERTTTKTQQPKHAAPAVRLYVAPNGKAENDGTESSPFATLTQARDAIRQLDKNGTIEVIIKGGVYTVTETFELTKEDSGTEEFPIIYRAGTSPAAKSETPIFSGGVSISNFKPVADADILKRIPKEAHEKVVEANVADVANFPPVSPRGYGKNGLGASPFVELFIDGKPQQIARWPNAQDALGKPEKAFVKTGKVHRGFFETKDSHQPGVFEYSDSRHERWTEAADAMLFGYWGHLWAITSCRIEKIDSKTKQVVLATNNPYGHRENMPYYAFNLLEEIDEPGEWHLDRKSGKLYIYPSENADINESRVRLTQFPKLFLSLKDVSNVSFQGLTFEEGSGTAANVAGGENVQFLGCKFHRFGNWGLGLSGKKHKAIGCDFVSLGGGGIQLNGGDVKTLTPGESIVENCLVNDFSRVDRAYAPAVHIDGVGNCVRKNLFCDSPAQAMRLEGMDHVIEYNEIHSVVYESDDQAGIDLWGNPYMRGIVIRYNYWHHIGSGRDVAGQSGIRLDDMISSVIMYGNVFLRSSGGQFGGIQIHGGKDNVAVNNLMIDCKFAVSFSPWGEKRWLEQLEKYFGVSARNKGFNPDSDVFKDKYADYSELQKNADRNIIVNNIAIGCDSFSKNNRRNVFAGNIMLPWQNSFFVETESLSAKDDQRVPADVRGLRGKLTLPENSPLYTDLGIYKIPFSEMGLYKDELRKTVPQIGVTPFFVQE